MELSRLQMLFLMVLVPSVYSAGLVVLDDDDLGALWRNPVVCAQWGLMGVLDVGIQTTTIHLIKSQSLEVAAGLEMLCQIMSTWNVSLILGHGISFSAHLCTVLAFLLSVKYVASKAC